MSHSWPVSCRVQRSRRPSEEVRAKGQKAVIGWWLQQHAVWWRVDWGNTGSWTRHAPPPPPPPPLCWPYLIVVCKPIPVQGLEVLALHTKGHGSGRVKGGTAHTRKAPGHMRVRERFCQQSGGGGGDARCCQQASVVSRRRGTTVGPAAHM
jgi:hypothetical protein